MLARRSLGALFVIFFVAPRNDGVGGRREMRVGAVVMDEAEGAAGVGGTAGVVAVVRVEHIGEVVDAVLLTGGVVDAAKDAAGVGGADETDETVVVPRWTAATHAGHLTSSSCHRCSIHGGPFEL